MNQDININQYINPSIDTKSPTGTKLKRCSDIDEHNHVFDELHEECGVFGMYDFDGGNVASTIYYGLFALQHRGQESCGIAVSDTHGPKGKVTTHKGMGLVNEVFTPDILEPMKGDIGVGHVRYSTAGSSTRENAQPLVLNYVKGTLAMAHNGNLINAKELRKELEYTGAIFQTTIDSEVIAYHIARERLNSKTAEEAVRRACQKLKGAYALVVESPRKLIAARDPFGFKPLCIGKRDNAYIVTSETCALDTIGAEFVRDIEPGEVITITPEKGIESDMTMALAPEKQARCVFEYIYFARPDSVVEGINVHAFRKATGSILAREDKDLHADIVIGVPDSSLSAAIGYAEEAGIPFETGLIKNRYIGSTFIRPTEQQRMQGMRVRLNAISSVVKDKRVYLVDDSVVKGFTSRRICQLLKEAGAKEVHLRIASPMLKYPCLYGADSTAQKDLAAFNYTVDEMEQLFQVDSLRFLSVEDFKKCVPETSCLACCTGEYPEDLQDLQERRLRYEESG